MHKQCLHSSLTVCPGTGALGYRNLKLVGQSLPLHMCLIKDNPVINNVSVVCTKGCLVNMYHCVLCWYCRLCDDPPPYDSMGTRRAVVARCLPGSLSSLPPYEEGGLGNPSLGLTNPGLCLSRETLPMPPPYEAPSQPPPDYQPSHDPQVVDNAPHDENSNPTTVDPGVTETVTRDTAVAMDTRDAMNTAAATETTTWQNPENCSGQNSLQRNCCREASTVNNNQPLQDNDEVIASAQNSSSISCDSELRSSVESSDLTGSSDAGMEEDVESPHSEYQPDSRWQHLARSRSPYRGQLGEERDTVGDTVDSEDKTSDSVSSIAMEVTCPVKDDSPGDVGHSH